MQGEYEKKKEIEHVDSASLNKFSYWLVESVKGRNKLSEANFTRVCN